jgi:hypothetical protein
MGVCRALPGATAITSAHNLLLATTRNVNNINILTANALDLFDGCKKKRQDESKSSRKSLTVRIPMPIIVMQLYIPGFCGRD